MASGKVEMSEEGNRELGQMISLSPTDYRILYTTYYDSIDGISPFFGYYFFNILLLMIQVLNFFWFYLIVRVLYNFKWKGKVGKATARDGVLQCQQ